MDDQIKSLVAALPAQKRKDLEADEQAVVRVAGPDGGMVEFALKPLEQLYGRGTGVNVDPQADEFEPLFMGIELAIQRVYKRDPSLTDGTVNLALDRLGQNPNAAVTDPLERAIQNALRFILSVNDYSRNEVRQALRRLVRSVEYWTRNGGRQGYLEFVRKSLRLE